MRRHVANNMLVWSRLAALANGRKVTRSTAAAPSGLKHILLICLSHIRNWLWVASEISQPIISKCQIWFIIALWNCDKHSFDLSNFILTLYWSLKVWSSVTYAVLMVVEHEWAFYISLCHHRNSCLMWSGYLSSHDSKVDLEMMMMNLVHLRWQK